jgi:hypothetical protein
VEIRTVLVLRVLVLEIVSKSRNGREFVAGRRIKVDVSVAAVDCTVADPNIGKTGGA